MKHKSSKFYSKADSKLLSSLWSAPGVKPKYLDYETQPNYDTGFSDINIADWMSVSSPEFKNEARFPVFLYPNNGIGQPLTTSGDYQRINEKFVDRPPFMNSAEAFKPDPYAPPKRNLFWFRLSAKYLYFTESKIAINVLGSFRYIDSTLTAKQINPTCFALQHKKGMEYKYCAETTEVMKKFLCFIQKKLRFDLDPVCKTKETATPFNKPGKIAEKIITQPYVLIPMPTDECNYDWNYRNHGKDWECLCKEGIIFNNF